MGKAANTPSSQLDYSFYDANAEIVHQIRLLNEEMCEFVSKNYGSNKVVFTSENRLKFDKLITRLPKAKEKRDYQKEDREMDVVDMFIIYLSSEGFFDQYSGASL